MLRLCTRQLTRRALLYTHTVPRLSTYVQHTNSCRVPPGLTRGYASRTIRELEVIPEQKGPDAAEQRDSTQDDLDSAMRQMKFRVPPAETAKLMAHAADYWNSAQEPGDLPEGWSTDWPEWGFLTSLCAPSPLFLMLPQLFLLLLRHGVKPWQGLTPTFNVEVPRGTGFQMFSQNGFVLRIAGTSYLVDYHTEDQKVYMLSDDSQGGELVEEDPAGVALFDRIFERDDTVRQDLFLAGYTPYVVEPTTEHQENNFFIPLDAPGEGEDILKMKADIDKLLVEMGREVPKDPEEWTKLVLALSNEMAQKMGPDGPTGELEKMQSDVDELTKLTAEIDELQADLAKADEILRKKHEEA